MAPLRSELASRVDALASAGRATVSETRTQLALYQLGGADAIDVLRLLDPAGFALVRLNDEGGDLRIDELDEGAVGIALVASKPAVAGGIYPVLSRIGFDNLLSRAHPEEIIWVHSLNRVVRTMEVTWRPWDDVSIFQPEPVREPSSVVRVLGAGDVIEPIGRWLLRDPDTDVSGALLSAWRAHAAQALSRALAQEVEPDGRLLFRGPPTTRFTNEAPSRVKVQSFSSLQRAAGWVHESRRELENRHGLLAAEVSRTSMREGDVPALASLMTSALEGARIAYGFGVSQQSRDALKTLSDLRKAVSDETSRLSDATRATTAAVTTSAVGNVGLIIARVTLSKDARFVAPAAIAIGIALAIYVGVVVWSGWHFLGIQSDLRRDWRDRLYRFLADDEYQRMVVNPVRAAENGFERAAAASGVIALLLLLAVVLVTVWS